VSGTNVGPGIARCFACWGRERVLRRPRADVGERLSCILLAPRWIGMKHPGIAMKISVLSDGGWGTALSVLFCHNGHQVSMWGPFPDYLAEMARTRRTDKFLKGVGMPAALELKPISGGLARERQSWCWPRRVNTCAACSSN